MSTYIVIVTYNGMAWLERCLASIPDIYPVVLVDNNSTDGTVYYIETNYPQHTLFRETCNLGFGQANNKGISYALKNGAEYVFLLNQDAYLEEDTVSILIETHQDYPDYGVLSPIHTNAEKTRLDKKFSHYISYDNNAQFYSDFVLGYQKQSIYDVPFVNAAGWLLPRTTLDVVGGFDPIFYHYGEDDNYCQRVRYHQFKIGVVPNAFMVHDREDRVMPLQQSESEQLLYFERAFKTRYADINIPFVRTEITFISAAFLLKLLLKLQFKKWTFYKKKQHLQQHLIKEVELSRQINITKGPHYL